MTFAGRVNQTAGRAFEVGFAAALDKPVWGYQSSKETLVERVKAAAIGAEGGFCVGGYLIEDFGLSVNLMLACSTQLIVGGPAACLDAILSLVDEGGSGFGGLGLAKR